MPLHDATIAIVGLGALGSRMATCLADQAAVRGIDRDVLEPGNLETSLLYTREQVEGGLPKAVAAQELLGIDGRVADLHGGNAEALLEGVDLILDGADTVATRRIINAWAVKTKTPWVHTAALASTGNLLPIIPGETACYRCTFGHVDGSLLDTCTTAGIDTRLADVVAEQAVNAAERILNREHPAGLTRFNGTGRETIAVARREDCPVCMGHRFDALEQEGVRTTQVCGDGTYHVSQNHEEYIEPVEIVEKLDGYEKVCFNEHLFRVRGGEGWVTVFRDGRAIVEAASREAARRRYAQVVGR